MMFLANNDKTQPRPLGLIRSILFFHDGCHSRDLDLIDLRKLAFGHAVSIKYDAAREVFVDAFEAFEEVVEHAFHVFDHFEAGVLDASCGDVARVPRVDGADEGGDGGLVASWTWVADVCSENHGAFFEPFAGWDKVDSSDSRVDSGEESQGFFIKGREGEDVL